MTVPTPRRLLSACALAAALLAGWPGPAAAAPARFAAAAKATEEALMADPRRALVLAQRSGRLAEALVDPRAAATARATARWLEAESLIELNRVEAAAAPAAEAAALARKAAPRSKLAGDTDRTLGAIAGNRGAVQQALRHYQSAYRTFVAAGEDRSSAIALLDIGQIYWDAGDYPRVLHYFAQAEERMPASDASLQLALRNARGEVLRTMGRHAEAEPQYRLALKAAATLKSDVLRARIYTNLATAQVQAGRLAAATDSVNRAFALADTREGAEWRPFIHATAARIAMRRGDLPAARRAIEAAFAGQDLSATAMGYREAHETAAALYERLGEQALAMRHLRAFQRLDKEAQALVASNAAQLMAAQFDFANQNLRISQLKQGQLERDIRSERDRSRYRTNLFVGVLAAGAVIVALLLSGFFSIRRSRNQVRAANTELAGTNSALEKALKAKTEFLATTSHEIRTPLNGILGMTQVILSDRHMAPDMREKIEVVHGAGQTMQALVDDLLDVAKLEHGGLTIVEERTDVRALLDDAVRLWRLPAEAKGLTLRIAAADLPPAVLTDGGRVRQILFNLVSNAVKFTPSGEVALSAAVEQGDAGDARLVLAVRDTGIGIDPADHAAIFEAFAQVDGGTTRRFSGTGLGLSIVGRLAEALGGGVAVDSALGAGATFTVRLPVGRIVETPAPVGGATVPGGLADATVLVVDGNPATRAMLHILLAPCAGSVVAAATRDEALARLADQAVGLVLLDAATIAAEAADRLPALRALVAAARAGGARVAVVQSREGEPGVAQLFTLGVDQIVVRPIAAPALIAALSALWSDDPPAFVAPALTEARHVA